MVMMDTSCFLKPNKVHFTVFQLTESCVIMCLMAVMFDEMDAISA